ncbi:SAM-dependent methyltransferase [Leifsonia sp. AK011]|uniref:methyltransferase domain-containing protein n=1 Tax=Leifsonia sp. AK011 TaxID=2723075 RepID=UPI0015C8BFCC|nr:class I SAM-dependent methyltransferase [Leifsonia sp. AK011]NYF11430.1 SAM-dependent methyltransferase [Leifsonia sp. AK011]
MSSPLLAGPAHGTFGLAADHPYELALRDPQRDVRLHEFGTRAGGSRAASLEVSRYRGAPDTVDRDILTRTRGGVLDLGCGPGRLVEAAVQAGRRALGVDVSATAVALAHERGLPVLRRSVFDPLPREGSWGTVLLLDGNIGIGGDPTTLIERCASLIDAQGLLVVETHAAARRDRRFTARLVDDLGRASLPFAWAEVGAVALRRHARQAGLVVSSQWSAGGRAFVALARG